MASLLHVAVGAAAGRLHAGERSWRQLAPMLASMFDSTRAVMSVLFMTFHVVIAILILNAMLMAVFERIKEFGVLKAIGLEPTPSRRPGPPRCRSSAGGGSDRG